MPVRILQQSPDGQTALVQYPDGRTAEMPVDLAQAEVEKSYAPETGPSGPVPRNAYELGSEQNPASFPQDEQAYAQQYPAQQPAAVVPQQQPVSLNVGVSQDVPAIPHRPAYSPDEVPRPAYSPDEVPHESPVHGQQPHPVAPVTATPAWVPIPDTPTPHGNYGDPRSGGRTHAGEDYSRPVGSPVTAQGAGKVIAVGQSKGDSGRGGNRVMVQYDNGVIGNYMHLDGIQAKQGDLVTPGTPLGTAGTSGNAQGAKTGLLHVQYTTPDGKPITPQEANALGGGGLSSGGSQSFSYSGQTHETPPITGPVDAGLPETPATADYLQRKAALGEEQKGYLALEHSGLTWQDQIEQQFHEQRAKDLAREQTVNTVATEHATRERAKYEAGIQEALHAVKQVDPARVWHNAGALGSAMGIFSAAIGGWLQLLHGGPNQALSAIQSLIDADIRAQETDINTQKEGVYRAERAYERSEGRIQDRTANNKEQSLFRLQALTEANKAESLKFKSPIRQAEFLKAQSVIDGAMLDTYKAAGDEHYNREFNKAKFNAEYGLRQEEARQGREQISIAQGRAETERAGAALAGKDGKPESVLYEPGTQRPIYYDANVPVSKEHYSNLLDRQRSRREVGQKAKDYKVLLDDIGRRYQGWGNKNRVLGSDDAMLLKARYDDLTLAIANARSGKTINEREVEKYTTIVGEPPGWTGVDPSKRIKALVRSLGDDENNDFDQIRARVRDTDPVTGEVTEKIYRPGEWYLAMPAGRQPENTTINELRGQVKPNSGLQSESPEDVLGSIKTFNDQLEMPDQLKAFKTNFPDLSDEVHGNALRAASDAKAAGDTNLAQGILDAELAFQNRWMKLDKRYGRGDVKDLKTDPYDPFGAFNQ